MRSRLVIALALCALFIVPAQGRACAETWTDIGHDSFAGPLVAPRSQGVVAADTALGARGWIFSGLNGLLEKTDADYHTLAVGTLPPDTVEPSVGADGSNHVSATHIGDLDVYDGKLYAPVEDGNESQGPVSINDPEYQHPYIAVYDARTLVYLRKYALPLDGQIAGVPWVAVNGPAGEVYTSEWGQPHDRINVYNLSDLSPKRTISLDYSGLEPNFKLDRIQGAKLLNGALYATRDDAAKTVFRIDLGTGAVSRLFSLSPSPAVPAELEGLAVTTTAQGPMLHVMLILHNDFDASFDFRNIVTELHHFAQSCV
ncbi:MAG: hypothetical protein ABR552_10685 [Actinomycetota bacterium]